MKIHLLGTRGSMPTGGPDFVKYGSDTSSYYVETDTQAIFLDAGTGICHAPDTGDRDISLFISHMHLDHIMGLTFFPMLSKDVPINIYADMPAAQIKESFDRLFSEPFWPCKLEDYRASLIYHSLPKALSLGDVLIESMEGNHPGGCKVLRVSLGGKSLVYATDYECDKDCDKKLIDFSMDSNLLIFDGQYAPEEYESHRGFGHSTKEMGIEIARAAGVKDLVFTHHDPNHRDDFLTAEESRISGLYENCRFAKQGEVISL